MENKMITGSSQRVRNEYGVRVWKHCFSCEHKICAGEENMRYCRLKKARVSPYEVCPMWKMSKGLLRCGAGQKGRVKKPEYHQYIMDNIRDKTYKNFIQLYKDLSALTGQFIQEHGTIYIDGKP